jgi:hypothetical protein
VVGWLVGGRKRWNGDVSVFLFLLVSGEKVTTKVKHD